MSVSEYVSECVSVSPHYKTVCYGPVGILIIPFNDLLL